ncbi:hypothetical protein C5B72_02470 [Acinetobacter sp. KU 011TH]|uniref:hypothetical protein n=1 Tax=Acinetobacter seifertii TaxID=1530123 RepID=UPI00105D0176|nr:hypothetical protein [Acinetobacter seifertii]TDM66400.1 hypothetical protein C5B72_02470 [Acinetobacter sp. KU 011TH]TDM67235.1 hypothetical protein C4608_02470 [Acinetobacter sp. KU 013TH]
MIKQILDYLNISWVGVIITLVISIFAIILTVFLYFKSKQKYSLNHYVSSNLLINKNDTEKPEEVEILFAGKSVDKLYKTLIYIWNSGNLTIRRTDLETIDKLRISIENNTEVLSMKIIHVTRNVINFSIDNQIDSKNHEIKFDYLDPKDGAVIEVFHTGNLNDLKLKGTVIGISDLIGNKNTNKFNKEIAEIVFESTSFIMTKIWMFGVLILVIGAAMCFCSAYLYFNPDFKLIHTFSDGLALGLGGFIYLFFGIALLYTNKRKFPKELELKEKNENKEDIRSRLGEFDF